MRISGRWPLTRFKNCCEDLSDDTRPGRPESENCAELVQNKREIIAVDGHFTVRMLAEELNTNGETVRQILTMDLGKKKVSARFVPHQLSDDQQIADVDIIATAKNDPDVLDSIITGDRI